MSAAEFGLTPQGCFEGNPLQSPPRKPLAEREKLVRQFHAPLRLLLSLESRSPEGEYGNFTVNDDRVRLAIAVHGSDPQRLVELLLAVAARHEDVLPAPAPEALLVGMTEDSLSLSLRFWTVAGTRYIDRLKSELRLQILATIKQYELAIGENNCACALVEKQKR